MPTLSISSLLNTFRQANTAPAPPNFTPAPRTVLITGANTGLGLAAAHHFVALGTTTLLLAVRTPATGFVAAEELKAAAAPRALGCHILQVDFAAPKSVERFVREVDKGVSSGTWPPVDVAILNAGVISKVYERVEGCAERTLQINALGNLLAAILLQRQLRRRGDAAGRLIAQPPQALGDSSYHDHPRGESEHGPENNEAATYKVPHLVLVSSILYSTIQLSTLPPDTQSILPELSNPIRPFATQAQYALSKLLLQIGASQLAHLTAPSSGIGKKEIGKKEIGKKEIYTKSEGVPDAKTIPDILITTVCPGPCQSDLARDFQNSSWLLRLGLRVYAMLFQRSTEQGARSIVSAVGAAADLATRAEDEFPGEKTKGNLSMRRGGDGGSCREEQSSAGTIGREWKHGGFWRNDSFEPLGGILSTSKGKAWAQKVWEEIVATLAVEVNQLEEAVESV